MRPIIIPQLSILFYVSEKFEASDHRLPISVSNNSFRSYMRQTPKCLFPSPTQCLACTQQVRKSLFLGHISTSSAEIVCQVSQSRMCVHNAMPGNASNNHTERAALKFKQIFREPCIKLWPDFLLHLSFMEYMNALSIISLQVFKRISTVENSSEGLNGCTTPGLQLPGVSPTQSFQSIPKKFRHSQFNFVYSQKLRF